MLKKSERRPMKYILIATALLASCGSLPGKTLVEKHLLMSVEDFEGYMGVEVNADISVRRSKFFQLYKEEKYRNKNVSVVALCLFEENKIIFNEDVIEELIAKAEKPQYELQPIVYHELGHCMFDLKHDVAEVFEGVPASWMHPVYQEKRKWDVLGHDHYKREFKSRALNEY